MYLICFSSFNAIRELLMSKHKMGKEIVESSNTTTSINDKLHKLNLFKETLHKFDNYFLFFLEIYRDFQLNI